MDSWVTAGGAILTIASILLSAGMLRQKLQSLGDSFEKHVDKTERTFSDIYGTVNQHGQDIAVLQQTCKMMHSEEFPPHPRNSGGHRQMASGE